MTNISFPEKVRIVLEFSHRIMKYDLNSGDKMVVS